MDDRELTYRDYAKLARLPLDEIERACDVQAFRASGPGGQCVNTTDSAVRMVHRPTGIMATSRESRSQFRNRRLCLQKLRAAFERRAVPPKARRASKPSKRAREQRLSDKCRRARSKQLRRRVEEED